MPLSEEEKHTLEQIENALLQDDPEFTAEASLARFRRHQRRILGVTALLFVIGTVLLITGLVTTHEQRRLGILVALTGLSAMTAGPIHCLRHWRD